MSTRSYVGKMNPDGSIRAIYVHYDGYLDGVGQILKDYYNTSDKIDKLLDLGDISTLGREPVGYWTNNPMDIDPDMCMTYRERGEKNVDARVYDDIDDFLYECTEDFTYLFKNRKWYYRQWDQPDLIRL